MPPAINRLLPRLIVCFMLAGTAACTNAGRHTPSHVFHPGITRDVPLMFNYLRALSADPLTEHPDAGRITHDRQRVDSLYLYALDVARGDHLRACALTGLACLTHRAIPLRFGLNVPLTFENDSLLNRRFNRMPRYLFNDSPAEGDSDKLQHFFMSAWLAMRSDSPMLSNFAGHIIEGGESLLIDARQDDERDLRANALGRRFARALQMDVTTMPSEVLRMDDADTPERE